LKGSQPEFGFIHGWGLFHSYGSRRMDLSEAFNEFEIHFILWG